MFLGAEISSPEALDVGLVEGLELQGMPRVRWSVS
jgi:hypothetical protein